MNGNRMGRGIKALAVSLALGLGMTACSRDYTVGYLYVTSATHTTAGAINAYSIDFQSGALQQLADSPIPSDGNNPVTLVASPNGKYIYVVNQSAPSSSITVFAIGTDGKLYEQGKGVSVVQGTNGVVGTTPTAAAIDYQGKFLYVTFLYQSGFTPLKPGPGGIATFPIAADGSLGAALVNTTVGTTTANPLPYIPLGNNPSGVITAAKGGFVYVIDQEKPANASPFGVLLTFSTGPTGALSPVTPTANVVLGGVAVGTSPAGIAEDPGARYIYVTDSTTNQLAAYYLTANGSPTPNSAGPYNTGLFPIGVTVDPRGSFVYVANYGSSTVSQYAIGPNGALAGGGSTSVATGPTCVTVDPAVGTYLYTSNNIDNSVSGEQLDPHTGALKQIQGTQFTAQALPTCAVAVANGAHATSLVY